MTESQITVDAWALARILRGTLPFVDPERPPINSIYLRAEAGVLTATATDRFTLIQMRTPTMTGDTMPAVLVSTDEAVALIRMLKTPAAFPNAVPPVTTVGVTERDARGMAFAGFSWTRNDDGAGPSLTVFSPDPTAFPKFETMLTAEHEPAPGPYSVNPGLLRRITKAAEKANPGRPLRMLPSSPAKPIRFECEDDFLVLLMPVRPSDNPPPAVPVMGREPAPEPSPA
jgi:hypothetical protein